MTPILDTEQLHNVTMGDQELMREVTAMLVQDAAAQVGQLGLAAESYNHVQCQRVAHTAKGSCGSVGAVALAELFQAAEQAAKCGDVPGCVVLLPKMAVEIERLRDAISQLSLQ